MINIEALSCCPNTVVIEKPKVLIPLLQEIPLAKDRPKAKPELLNTAGHELNHALAAIASGISVLDLSVIPTNDSLGRTMFAGHIPVEKLQVIAAAGKVATHDGCAHGHESDMLKVHILSHLYNGMPAEKAVMIAHSIISKYPIEVRRRTADIIAYMGEISGSKIPLILERARIELNLEKGTPETNSKANAIKQATIQSQTQQQDKHAKRTVIYYLPNGVNINLFKPAIKKKSMQIKNILSVGRLETQKNFKNLIKALSGLNVRLTIVGEGSLKTKLKFLAKKMNVDLKIKTRVNFFQMPSTYRKSDVFVSSSLFK